MMRYAETPTGRFFFEIPTSLRSFTAITSKTVPHARQQIHMICNSVVFRLLWIVSIIERRLPLTMADEEGSYARRSCGSILLL